MSAIPFTEAADRVKYSLDIVDVVQRHVILKRSGRNFTGKCPFHNDKSPSMSVSREKGVFKCFACGVGGDALSFLMRIENKTYGEIIRDLAEEQGLEIAYEGKPGTEAPNRDTRQKILELNAMANRWFGQQLASGTAAPVRAYLEGRVLDTATFQRFQLGYAPAGWENLVVHLNQNADFIRSTPELLVTAGLANTRENAPGYYDRFRNRLIVPIHDEKGQVVAFGGRALSDEDKPKYLNSPETQVYKKSQVLYGMHLAKDSIRESRKAVIMEGYFDVIRAHMAGVTQAVGSCGTALTDQHLKLLTRFGAETVYLAFDSDEAGLKAALSAIQLIEPYMDSADLQVKVLIVPNGKDPDDYIRQEGGEAFKTLMVQAQHFLNFKFDMALRDLQLQSPEGRIQAANRITPLLAGLNRPTLRSEYIRQYSEKIGISEEALQLEIRRYEQAKNPHLQSNFNRMKIHGQKKAISKYPSTSLKRSQLALTDNVSQLLISLSSKQVAAEKDLLRILLYNPECFHIMYPYLQNQTAPIFQESTHSQIWEGLSDFGSKIDPLADGFMGTLVEKMNHLYLSEQPEAQHTFAELVLTAEPYGDSLDLGELKGSPLREKVTALAENRIVQLETWRKQRQLQQLCQNQPDEIERQYELRDRLLETQQLNNSERINNQQGS